MSIDAQAWVWNESRTRGNARLVMLAVADKAPGPDCSAYMGLTEFLKRVNAARSTTIEAIDKALASGELVITEEARGSRPAKYQLPKAIGYQRPDQRRGPETGPVSAEQGSGIQTPNSEQGSENRTGSENARGPETGPGGSENRTPRGPDSGPHYQTSSTKPVVESWETATPADRIPDVVRPLVDGMNASGLRVRWPFQGGQWFEIHALMKRSGTAALIEYALAAAAGAKTPVLSAKYFLGGWRELAPLPEAGSEIVPLGRPPLRAVNGHQPAQPKPSTTDQRVQQAIEAGRRVQAMIDARKAQQ